jgi:cation diffusion facilitator family transporter
MSQTQEIPLHRYAWLSVAAAVATLAIKTFAYFLTQSIGIFSDALESLVNLTAAIFAVRILIIAARPPDRDHAYGHGKAEFFSSIFEGILILVAGLSIIITAVERLVEPRAIERIGLGLAIALSASLINLVVARILIRQGRSRKSIALEADGHHLMTDVWTSVGILAGVGAVGITGWQKLDPIIGIIVAANIGWMGIRLVRRSILGLMDPALPEAEIQKINAILAKHSTVGITYHAMRTRQAGARSFVSMQIQAPGSWTLKQSHDVLEAIEREIRDAIPGITVFTHIEPTEDPRSWGDESLDRFELEEDSSQPTKQSR